MMENRGVLSIIFDLDNTLIDTAGAGREAIQEVCELLRTRKIPERSISTICSGFSRKLHAERFQSSEGRTIDQVRIHHWAEALRETLGSDPDLDPALASSCYHTWKSTRLRVLSLTPEVRALLEELSRDYKLVLLTNGDTQTQWEKVRAVGCEGLFRAVVVGGDQPEQKPASSIFRYCFGLVGVGPRDCLMVGDSLATDIQGGADAGVRATVWINSEGKSLPLDSVTPDYTLHSVLRLKEVLEDLA